MKSVAPGLILVLCACTSQAQDTSSWIVRAGVHPVQPKPHNHPQIHISDGVSIGIAGTFMITRRWGVDAFAALPIEHDISLRQAGLVAHIEQLPVTVSAQYQFLDPNGRVRGYVGAGFIYTVFLDEQTTRAWTGGDLRLESSFGPAAQLGLDFDLGRTWFIGLDARWFDIDSRARLDGASIGTIEIDPYAVGVSVGKRLP